MVNTPIYGIELPDPGADEDQWAPTLNNGIVSLEERVEAARSLAASAQSAAATAGNAAAAAQTDIDAHEARIDNPHATTAAQVGTYTKAEIDALIASGGGGSAVDQTARDAAAAAQTDIDTHEARTDNPHAVTAAQVGALTQTQADARYVNTAGDTMTGALGVPNPTDGSHAVNKTTLDLAIGDFITQPQAAAAFVSKGGDTMTGALTLSGVPFVDEHAANKAYVDGMVAPLISQTAADARYINVIGDTMTGALFCTATIDQAQHLATKQYVDAAVAAGGGGGTVDQVARDAAAAAQADISAHEIRFDNPHGVTAAQVGALTQAAADTRYVNTAGDTMTGPLTLAGAPTVDLHAATKKYVDDTAAGGGAAEFPSGTRMLFQQTAAPPGWTKDVTLNDRALRVVSGTVGGGGTLAFSAAFASRALTGAVQNTTMTTGQMPSHAHNINGLSAFTVLNPATQGGTATNAGGSSPTVNFTSIGVSAAGGGSGGSHNHALAMNDLDMAVAYTDVIVATKD